MQPVLNGMVYIVDDDASVRDALAWLLRSRRLQSETFDSAEAFEALLARPGGGLGSQPACLMLDVRMPGISGLALFDRLLGQGLTDRLPVIFLTGHGDVPMAVETLKQGAFDFVEKPFNDNSLVDRLAAALDESRRRLEESRQKLSLEERLAALTSREREVLDLVVEGHYNKVIADRLGIAMRTVEVYRARVFGKMGVKSAVELAAMLASRHRED